MDEPEFVSRVLEACDCGWLCDVTNIVANAVNQRRDLEAELDRWPWDRAVQAHLAGGRIAKDGRWIDSHDRPAPPEALSLLRTLSRRGAPERGHTRTRRRHSALRRTRRRAGPRARGDRVSLAETQAALARLFTTSAARAEFVHDPLVYARTAGLEGAEADALSKMAASEVERYAMSLRAKRKLDVEKWLPLTARACPEFARLLRESLAEPPPGARADACALITRLQSASPRLDRRSRGLRGRVPARFWAGGVFFGPPLSLAGAAHRGRASPPASALSEAAPAPTLALWARSPRGRLRHRWWILGRETRRR